MTSGDSKESRRLKDADGPPAIKPAPDSEAHSALPDTVVLMNDGTPRNRDVEFVLNMDLETLPLPNRFCVQKMLGKGGFGCVYLATDQILQRVVAIKIPHRSRDVNEELSTQFLRESRVAAKLNHPSIVRVLDSGESDGVSWQVAEYVDGPRLCDFRTDQGGTLSARSAARIVRQLADAVQHAHSNGVLHRDIKPENILLEKLSKPPDSDILVDSMIPRLTDFGLARLVEDNIAFSRSGMIVGTPKYMAPEQLSGKASMQGPWTDIYSLGVVLHELLTGAIPFPDAVDLPSRLSISEQAVRSFRASQPGISRDLETICLKCLHSQPKDRYASAGALRDDLTRFLDGRPTLARPLSVYERALRWSDKNRLLATLISLLSVAVVVVFLQLNYNARRSHEQNRNLLVTNDLLKTEKQRSDHLLRLAEDNQVAAERNRIRAEQHESKFRSLAWYSTLRECLTSLTRKQYFAAWILLDSLRQSQPENIHRPEWQLTSQELQRHYEPILSAGYPLHEITTIPGTTLLAVAGESHRVDLIDSQTFKRTRSIQTDIPKIHAIAVSSDGKRIAVGGSMDDEGESAPIIYSLETGEKLQSLPPHVTTIESLLFSPDGQQLVCGSRYRPVRIFRLSDSTERQVETTRRNQWLQTSPDGTEFAAFASSNSIVISSFDDPTKSRLISTGADIEFCAWIPQSRVLACTHYQSDFIVLINADSGERIGRFLHFGKDFSWITVSQSPNMIIAGCVDGSTATCQIPERWLRAAAVNSSSATGSQAAEELVISEILQLDNQTVTGIVISGDTLFCSSASGHVSAFHFPSQVNETATQKRNQHSWYSATISRNGDVFTGKRDGTIVKLNASFTRSADVRNASFADAIKNDESAVVIQDNAAVDEIAVSANGRYLAWSNWDAQVQLLDLTVSDTRALSPRIEQALGSIEAVCFSADSQRIAWTGKEQQLSAVRITEPFSLQTVLLSNSGGALQFSPDSAQLARGGRADQLTIVSSDKMTTNTTLNNCSDCSAIEWHSSGQSLLLGFRSGSIQIRRLVGVDSIQRSYVHRKEVRDIALSPDGNLAVSVDDSGQVAMWNAETGEIFGVLFEPAVSTHGVILMAPALEFLDTGELVLIYDDGTNSPQIVRWQSVSTPD